jgi:hypothetical protein
MKEREADDAEEDRYGAELGICLPERSRRDTIAALNRTRYGDEAE